MVIALFDYRHLELLALPSFLLFVALLGRREPVWHDPGHGLAALDQRGRHAGAADGTGQVPAHRLHGLVSELVPGPHAQAAVSAGCAGPAVGTIGA